MHGLVILHDAATHQWLRFEAPAETLSAYRLQDVGPALRRLEQAVEQDGRHAAGFISYEAAPAFDTALRVRPADQTFPLLWFGLYGAPVKISPPARPASPSLLPGLWTPSMTESEYAKALARIRNLLAAGDTYQVNFTMRLHAPFHGSAQDLFAELVQAQVPGYSAFIDLGRFVVCSASPELFFQRSGPLLESRPMKGTAARGRTLVEDQERAHWLRDSAKNRAENIMIVDMIRNDLGRVADTGTVQVTRLADVECYPTVWQMTSTVTATTAAPTHAILTALFPCASITGAPKPRTMAIIADLETAPRRIYSGSIGFLQPGGKAQFNVAIRTVLIDREKREAEYGVGGGIVWDSDPVDEYAECMLKARVLTAHWPDFALLETILWTPTDGYFLLPHHLRRLLESAQYFDFKVAEADIRHELTELAKGLSAPSKIRLLVNRSGPLLCESSALPASGAADPVRLHWADSPVDSGDPFLYHKTTHREVYARALRNCPAGDDVLLWNERGEITETSIANVVLELGGEQVTPPVASGLLAGTFRAWLLEQGQVRERIIHRDEVARAARIYLINSVRKRRTAVIAERD